MLARRLPTIPMRRTEWRKSVTRTSQVAVWRHWWVFLLFPCLSRKENEVQGQKFVTKQDKSFFFLIAKWLITEINLRENSAQGKWFSLCYEKHFVSVPLQSLPQSSYCLLSGCLWLLYVMWCFVIENSHTPQRGLDVKSLLFMCNNSDERQLYIPFSTIHKKSQVGEPMTGKRESKGDVEKCKFDPFKNF